MRNWENIVKELFEEFKEESLKNDWYACPLHTWRGAPYGKYQNELERKICMLPIEYRMKLNKLCEDWGDEHRSDWDRKIDLARLERLKAKGKI